MALRTDDKHNSIGAAPAGVLAIRYLPDADYRGLRIGGKQLSSGVVDVAIIGAGPYGLSIAAHLRKAPLSFRIFGLPMQTWSQHMPQGMLLKSEGFASSLYDPDSTLTLRHYCEEVNVPYADVGIPVSRETFVAYGLEFQRRLVPTLEKTAITSVRRTPTCFELLTADGETVQARNVVVAAGISHFGYLPPFLAGLPGECVSHSLHLHDLTKFRGTRVAVIGGGASALDSAALLHEAGAQVDLVTRRNTILFSTQSQEPRSLLQRIKRPRSGLGTGWRSRLCTDAPLLIHALPQQLRLRIVQRHLGPSAGWFVRDKILGRLPLHLGSQITEVSVKEGKAHLRVLERDGRNVELVVDHIIAATGFRAAVSRLTFLEESLRSQILLTDGAPILSAHFESSVPGLYFVGVASANSFGPLTRFAYGARFTARRLAHHLAASTDSDR
jgi:thioredoxin reductase